MKDTAQAPMDNALLEKTVAQRIAFRRRCVAQQNSGQDSTEAENGPTNLPTSAEDVLHQSSSAHSAERPPLTNTFGTAEDHDDTIDDEAEALQEIMAMEGLSGEQMMQMINEQKRIMRTIENDAMQCVVVSDLPSEKKRKKMESPSLMDVSSDTREHHRSPPTAAGAASIDPVASHVGELEATERVSIESNHRAEEVNSDSEPTDLPLALAWPAQGSTTDDTTSPSDQSHPTLLALLANRRCCILLLVVSVLVAVVISVSLVSTGGGNSYDSVGDSVVASQQSTQCERIDCEVR